MKMTTTDITNQLTVKRTFFTKNGLAPCFELEDGTIKIPIIMGGDLTWVSKEDYEVMKNRDCVTMITTVDEAYEKLESAIDTLIELNNGVTHEDIQKTIDDLREVEKFLITPDYHPACP